MIENKIETLFNLYGYYCKVYHYWQMYLYKHANTVRYKAIELNR